MILSSAARKMQRRFQDGLYACVCMYLCPQGYSGSRENLETRQAEVRWLRQLKRSCRTVPCPGRSGEANQAFRR